MISSFRSEVDEICPLLEYYETYSGKCLPTFFPKLVFFFFLDFLKGLIGCPEIILSFSPGFLTLENGTNVGCPETSARNYHYMLRNIRQERRFQQCVYTRYMKQSFKH